MSFLRLILVWLLFAAVPLQGFAASTSLFCKPAGGSGQPHARSAAHDHHFGSAAHDASAAGELAAAHECGACAACCHVIAAAPSTWLEAAGSGPSAGSPEPLLRIDSRTSLLPDKPPRA